MRYRLLFLFFIIPGFLSAAEAQLPDSKLVLQKSDSPLVAFRILFRTGSSYDPKGKEGLASLTTSLLTEGSTSKNDYQKILQLLFPMAASYTSQTDKEMTTIVGVVHKDNLIPYYHLLRDAVLSPAFRKEDFDRLKTDQLNYVAKSLRFNDDEELGKETLSWAIFHDHPYGHPNEGTVSGNSSILLQDVQDFYRNQFTQTNLTIGIAGSFTDELLSEVRKDFSTLPAGSAGATISPPAGSEGWKVFIVEKKTPATGISLGFPVSFTRANDDFYPLMMVSAWLGQHRTQFGRLYNVMREKRGLNYGDYTYIEHFPFGGRTFQPRPNFARSRQTFQIWIRPVPNALRHFALRQAARELQLLIDRGMSQKDFDATKNFILNYIVSLAQTNSEQLGYALDDVFYQLPKPFLAQVRSRLETMKLDDLNQALRRNFSTKNMTVAIVTEDAESFKKSLVENTVSPIHYEAEKSSDILEEDKEIIAFPLPVKAENVTIIPVEKMFE